MSQSTDLARLTLPAAAQPVAVPQERTRPRPQRDPTWQVIVLNDDVNLMTYVTHVFSKVFGYEKERARQHMIEVHERGRSVLWSGGRERAEHYAHTLQQWHLTAILEAHA